MATEYNTVHHETICSNSRGYWVQNRAPRGHLLRVLWLLSTTPCTTRPSAPSLVATEYNTVHHETICSKSRDYWVQYRAPRDNLLQVSWLLSTIPCTTRQSAPSLMATEYNTVHHETICSKSRDYWVKYRAPRDHLLQVSCTYLRIYFYNKSLFFQMCVCLFINLKLLSPQVAQPLQERKYIAVSLLASAVTYSYVNKITTNCQEFVTSPHTVFSTPHRAKENENYTVRVHHL